MLKKLTLSNFRIFDDEVTIKFRPITVLIGKNNAGKSSVIKFLLMLKQTVDSGSTEFLNPSGNSVKLGLFEYLKNTKSDKKFLYFSLEMYGDRIDLKILNNHCNEYKASGLKNLTLVSSALVQYPKEHDFQEQSNSRFTVMENKLPIDELNLYRMINSGTRYLDFNEDIFNELESKLEHTPQNSSTFEPTQRIAAQSACLHHFKDGIQALRHLYPVKTELSSKVFHSPPMPRDVGSKGEYTLQHLKKIFDEGGENREFVEKFLTSVISVRGLKFNNPTNTVIEAFATDEETNAEVNIGQFGPGVSQCIPIIVQGTIMPEYTSMIVEHPETQIHPTAQLELGSYFAELWTKRRVGSIIETHSRNILLRLRRLIAEGKLNAKSVSVVFFDIENEKPLVKNLEIDSNGDLEKGLPAQFFGAGTAENLKIGIANYGLESDDDE